MLQQTQVDRVVPHYERFLAAFPTPAACAAAGPAAVVRLWSGLGYNRRALNLHRAAVAVVADHAGMVPHDDAALRALPGVGPYTARAVRTFAFGDDVAAVDTNGVRVLARGVAGTPLTLREAMALGTGSCRPASRGSSTRRCSTWAPPCARRRDPTAPSARCAVSAPGAARVRVPRWPTRGG